MKGIREYPNQFSYSNA